MTQEVISVRYFTKLGVIECAGINSVGWLLIAASSLDTDWTLPGWMGL